MSQTIFLTGFPGFLGSALVEKLLDRYDSTVTITCLIQRKFRALAAQKAFEIERKNPHRLGRIILLEGDITQPGLSIGSQYELLQEGILEIYHLAAVYDLGVKKAFALKVNVEGTRHMLDFASQCPNLKRFQYVSTCYVSGKYDGRFTEQDLDKGQSFNNFYEETKYLAECEVQRYMNNGLPCTIYRPGTVVGDSKTGNTQKYDGIYAIILLLLKQYKIALMPTIGAITQHTVNIVPQDFVIESIAYLSQQQSSLNKVYQLANPNPPTVQEVLSLLSDATSHVLFPIPLPLDIAKGALSYIPFATDILGIKPDALNYFVHPTTYGCENTITDLKDTDISCPPFDSYVATLVDFVKNHPDISEKAMV